jgi:hypothetical protein
MWGINVVIVWTELGISIPGVSKAVFGFGSAVMEGAL